MLTAMKTQNFQQNKKINHNHDFLGCKKKILFVFTAHERLNKTGHFTLTERTF